MAPRNRSSSTTRMTAPRGRLAQEAESVNTPLLVDERRIVEITRGDPALLRRFSGLLVATLESSTPDLASSDPTVRKHAAHRLKGACANLGAVRLHGHFERLERDPAVADLEAVDQIAADRAATLVALEELAGDLETRGSHSD
jgi:HPt (histidine-containing phosphotransfer) domain-containing protein